ncbi:addiction module HigA family antidote [Bradyrhizobium sp. USDA 4516]
MKHVQHPGEYIRQRVIPAEMTVTKAAVQIGVSRPALSNLLNGNADLSPEMAARLEAAFGVSPRDLLDRQSAWDAAKATGSKLAPTIKSYVPPFLQIKAARIEEWAASGIAPRSRLSVFLRTLINSTGAFLTKVDFPGNDDSEQSGWDGEVMAEQATPWIPAGHSGWEFGVNENVKRKADHDFGKSVDAIDDETQRRGMTFVFVTPSDWSGKAAWVREQNKKKLWKEVRAYDAQDLEQWLEQSLPGQAWFANETGQPTEGVISLDEAWKNWVADCEPPLDSGLFADALRSTVLTIERGLTQDRKRPTTITADSGDEALAFLSAAFAPDNEKFGIYRDRIIVFRQPGPLSRLASQVSNFIPVIASREVELEFAPFRNAMPSFVIYPRNASSDAPDIELETVNRETFETALRAMGLTRDRIEQLGRESGRSPTVLRRRLSKTRAINQPDWAYDPALAASLIPFMLVGVWKSDNEADQAMLELLAGDVPYPDLERRVATLLPLDGTPLWSAGVLRGVISKIDVLFAISSVITPQDLERFFDVAAVVLGENDPALELPEEDRWAAIIYGKKREISGAVRNGLAETLVMLAVYGPNLFRGRTNVDTASKAANLVRSLLAPMTVKILESQVDNLSLYAEAAPEEFLSLIEADLQSTDSAAMALMRPVSDTMFGGSPRTGLLWALEGLAWSEELFLRTVLVLARLAERSIDDNLTNKPSGSLSAIFRSWMPQTSAHLSARKAALKKLVEKFPAVAWPICLDQFSPYSRIGYHSHKPRWRPDGHGVGDPVGAQENNDFALFAFELTIGWPSFTREMIGDLLNHMSGVVEALQLKLWDVIDKWIDTASDADKSILREHIRTTTMTRRAIKQKGGSGAQKVKARARSAYDRLKSSDPVLKHAWLFKQTWIDESADELVNEEFDHRAREARISDLREAAVRDVFAGGGITALMKLAETGEAGHSLGWSFAAVTVDNATLTEALVEIVEGGEIVGVRWAVVSGILSRSAVNARGILALATSRVSAGKVTPLLIAAPFDSATWSVVDKLGLMTQEQYWREVQPGWNRDAADLVEGVKQLIKARRPRAAFRFAHFDLKELPPLILFDLMVAIAASTEASGTYQLDRHDLREAFRVLTASGEVGTDAMAGLEFQFIDIFDDEEARPENLERQIGQNPELFVQAVAFSFKRSDDAVDPPELRADETQLSNRARACYQLLQSITRIPGTDDKGAVDQAALIAWVEQVRARNASLARIEIGDQMIGKLLSHAPAEADGVWPCLPVRDALEHVMTEEVERGIAVALFNSRGVHWRGVGGGEERELAAKYGRWAQAMEYSHPRVSAMLRGMERSYLSDAEREDIDAKINRRLGR